MDGLRQHTGSGLVGQLRFYNTYRNVGVTYRFNG